MNKISIRKRQGGAVAIMVGISMFMLMAFLGLVLDLGPLYVGKTELQNAADAAALSGAKELKGDLDGIGKAEVAAIDTFDQQNFKVPPWVDDDFAKPATTDRIDETNLWVGNCPDDDCMVPIADVDTEAEAQDKTFLKVDSGKRQIHAWIMSIFGQNMTSTFGLAVAGRYLTPITPIGVCALRDEREAFVSYGAGASDQYQVEFGYMRGVSYDIQGVNDTLSGLAAGTALYIHPTATPETGCNPSAGNADFAAPFLCSGQAAISGAAGSTVYTNTGLAAGKSIAALNTRFDQYGPPLDSSLDYTVCAPDANIRQYPPAVASNWITPIPDGQAAIFPATEIAGWHGLDDWLAGVKPAGGGTRVTLPGEFSTEKENKGGCNGDCSDNYGVLWSYTRPMRVSGSFATTDWPALYSSGPTSPTYPEPSPYEFGLENQDPTYFLGPDPLHTSAVRDRRVLNVLIIDCPAAGGGACEELTVLGVGKFFMQTPAEVSSWVTGEFAGLVPEAALLSDIRLYR